MVDIIHEDIDRNKIFEEVKMKTERKIVGIEIVDNHTGLRVGKLREDKPGAMRRARSTVDRMDNKYGAYRYSARFVYEDMV